MNRSANMKNKEDTNSNSLEVYNLVKAFKVGNQKFEVLRGLTFNVKKGEFLSIMGPSGCGKSTLLYLLGGLDKPTKGTIILNGKDLTKMKEKDKSVMRRREIGFVFQFYNLVPNLSVEENILLPLLIDGKSPRKYKKSLNDILDTIQMTDRRRHYPSQLSGGQQQRVAIARALLFGPEIILADEPTGNLDSKSAEEIMEILHELHQSGRTIVMVTHEHEIAEQTQRIIAIRDGLVEADNKNGKR